MNTVFIYALNCPVTGQTRYVGKAVNPSRRFKKHLSDVSSNPRTDWIRGLLNAGLKPTLEVLDEVPEEFWLQWEIAWIDFFRELGFNLVNSNIGGAGPTRHSAEAIFKMRAASLGKPKSETHREHIRIAKLGNTNMLGKHHSEETRAKLSAGKKGKSLSEAHCKALSAAKLGTKQTPEHIEKRMAPRRGRKDSPEVLANKRAAHLGKKHSDAARANMRESWKLRKLKKIVS